MPTIWTWRPTLKSDLWYLITQLGILCDNSWNRIKFHTWTFYDSQTQWTARPII
jgi:hypothetical protein